MTEARPLVGLLLAAAAGGLVYLLAPILTPFLFAALLAYVANPLVGWQVQRRVPRPLAVILVFALFLLIVAALLLFLVPVVQRQLAGFAARLPVYLDWLQHRALPWVEQIAGAQIPLDVETLRITLTAHWQEMGGWLKAVLAYVTASGLRLLAWVVNLALVPVVTFYLLLDWDRLTARALGLLPHAMRGRARDLARETDAVLSSFLRGQLMVMLTLAAVYSMGLLLIGLDLALPIGLLAGLLSFVPYLGFLTGLVAAGVGAYAQFQDPHTLLWVLALFGAGQLLEGLVLTPRLVGRRTGLHPVAVIFAVLAGGQLFGFVGVLLALPAAAALKVWLRHLHERYVLAPPPAKRRRPTRRAP